MIGRVYQKVTFAWLRLYGLYLVLRAIFNCVCDLLDANMPDATGYLLLALLVLAAALWLLRLNPPDKENVIEVLGGDPFLFVKTPSPTPTPTPQRSARVRFRSLGSRTPSTRESPSDHQMGSNEFEFVIRAVAHRAASLDAVENTAAAIRTAQRNGATAVHIDASITSDGMAVAMHDRHLGRLTHVRGSVRNIEWARLCDLRLVTRKGAVRGDDMMPPPLRVRGFSGDPRRRASIRSDTDLGSLSVYGGAERHGTLAAYGGAERHVTLAAYGGAERHGTIGHSPIGSTFGSIFRRRQSAFDQSGSRSRRELPNVFHDPENVSTLQNAVFEALALDLRMFIEFEVCSLKLVFAINNLFKESEDMSSRVAVVSQNPWLLYLLRRINSHIVVVLKAQPPSPRYSNIVLRLLSAAYTATRYWLFDTVTWYMLGASAVVLPPAYVTAASLRRWRMRGIRVIVSTVNDLVEKEYFGKIIKATYLTDSLMD